MLVGGSCHFRPRIRIATFQWWLLGHLVDRDATFSGLLQFFFSELFNYFHYMFQQVVDQELTVAFYGPQPFLIALTPNTAEVRGLRSVHKNLHMSKSFYKFVSIVIKLYKTRSAFCNVVPKSHGSCGTSTFFGWPAALFYVHFVAFSSFLFICTQARFVFNVGNSIFLMVYWSMNLIGLLHACSSLPRPASTVHICKRKKMLWCYCE